MAVPMDKFEYSKDFQETILGVTKALRGFPNSERWLDGLLGGPSSRFIMCVNCLCPEIEYHCGNLADKRVLDFGCGTGPTTAALAYYSHKVCAFDIDGEVIEICKKRIREHGLESRVQFYSADDLDTAKASLGTFDIVVINGVIEHIPLSKSGLRKKIMRSLFDILEKSGYYVHVVWEKVVQLICLLSYKVG
jgi:2-polyprenyl-3-methyl-5-hydroxy-6-metoxy-1,4-benzoquinol methylase